MYRSNLIIAVFVAITVSIALASKPIEPSQIDTIQGTIDNGDRMLETQLAEYLESKGSPLAKHSSTLLEQEHWKLLVAISRMESAWCTRKLSFNCWGIGGHENYRHYNNYDEAIIDANRLISLRQSQGKWVSVEDMNCSYVVPCNETWVYVVNETLNELNTLFN